LVNTPEGNRMIIQTMREIANYDIQRGQIARQVQLGQITPTQADEAYRALPNPVAPFVQSSRTSQAPAVDLNAATAELEALLNQ
jgi:flagellar protein FlgJ